MGAIEQVEHCRTQISQKEIQGAWYQWSSNLNVTAQIFQLFHKNECGGLLPAPAATVWIYQVAEGLHYMSVSEKPSVYLLFWVSLLTLHLAATAGSVASNVMSASRLVFGMQTLG